MNLIDYEILSEYVQTFLKDWIAIPFSFGLLLGTVLEILGYGIFKAVSLLNINQCYPDNAERKGVKTMSEAMTTAFSTALTSVQADVTTMVTTALPIGLGIMGLFLAIRLGINFFRSIAH